MKNILLLSVTFLSVSSIFGQARYVAEDFIHSQSSNNYTKVGIEEDGLDSPVDLEFHSKDQSELWVINMRVESRGGSTVTYRNVGEVSQLAYHKVDGNSVHFMSLPTALAFGDNGAWASSPGVLDANFSQGQNPPFTGPSLWSSDFAVYAQYAGPGTNGSHLDMLHGSPYCSGIAWYKNNEYFVFDGYNGHLVWYDFATDHGPGNSSHDDGRIRRYKEVSLTRSGLIPGHMEIDEARKWLYINDVGASRIIRVDLTSGTVKGVSTTAPSERLAENVDMEGVVWEVVANTGLDKPCGLEISKDQLIVTDNGTSEIVIYDLSKEDGTFPELGRIKVAGYSDMMGVKVDHEGKMWFVDKTAKAVIRIDNDKVNMREADGAFVSLDESSKDISQVNIYPNPALNNLNIAHSYSQEVNVLLRDLTGRTIISKKLESTEQSLDLSELKQGVYLLSLESEGELLYSDKVIKR